MNRKYKCGICESLQVVKVLDFGDMPLANAFLTKAEFAAEQRYPLRVYFCENCYSVQLLDIVDPETVFRKYEYLTSASKPLSDHFIQMGQEMCDRFITSKDDLVIEIGGNDGVLLEAIKDRCLVLNIDPAERAAEICVSKGIPAYPVFFNTAWAEKITPKAKVVIANNVMAHISDIRDAFQAVKSINDGVFVFEVHWLGNLISTGGFDQIYHEHIYYHSLTALKYLTDSLGMTIFDVELVPIHGESMRVFAGDYPVSPKVEALLDREWEMGLTKKETFRDFYGRIFKNKKVLVELCRMLRREKKKIVGYGAPAKGNTLLNYYGIDLDYIVDTTPGKQGRYTPGMHIEVSPPERLLQEPPDYILMLAWNYADMILEKERKLRDSGVRFVIPVPEVRIVEP